MNALLLVLMARSTSCGVGACRGWGQCVERDLLRTSATAALHQRAVRRPPRRAPPPPRRTRSGTPSTSSSDPAPAAGARGWGEGAGDGRSAGAALRSGERSSKARDARGRAAAGRGPGAAAPAPGRTYLAQRLQRGLELADLRPAADGELQAPGRRRRHGAGTAYCMRCLCCVATFHTAGGPGSAPDHAGSAGARSAQALGHRQAPRCKRQWTQDELGRAAAKAKRRRRRHLGRAPPACCALRW